MGAQQVAVIGPLHPDAMARLDRRADLRIRLFSSFASAGNALADITGLTLRSDRLDADIAAGMPALRIVSRVGVGIDNLDLDALAARHVAVAIAPANADAVAEHTLGLMFAVTRQICQANAAVRADDYAIRTRLAITEIAGATILIVGYGRIGRAVARRCRALDMRVIVHDPYVAADADLTEDGVFSELIAALSEADIVSLHATPSPDGRPIIDRTSLNNMKQGAYLVNCGRGSLVDETALAESLIAGHLAGAGLDVTHREPLPANDPLLECPNLVVTPHCAPLSEATFRRTCLMAAENLLAALDGHSLAPDRQVLPKPRAVR